MQYSIWRRLLTDCDVVWCCRYAIKKVTKKKPKKLYQKQYFSFFFWVINLNIHLWFVLKCWKAQFVCRRILNTTVEQWLVDLQTTLNAVLATIVHFITTVLHRRTHFYYPLDSLSIHTILIYTHSLSHKHIHKHTQYIIVAQLWHTHKVAHTHSFFVATCRKIVCFVVCWTIAVGSDLTGLKKEALIFWRFSLILERWREKPPLLVWVFCFSLKVKKYIKDTQIFKCWPWNRGDYGWFWFNDCRDKCKIKSSYTNKLFYTRHNYFRQSNSLQMMKTQGIDARKVGK